MQKVIGYTWYYIGTISHMLTTTRVTVCTTSSQIYIHTVD